jgi:hypothetical protein
MVALLGIGLGCVVAYPSNLAEWMAAIKREMFWQSKADVDL